MIYHRSRLVQSLPGTHYLIGVQVIVASVTEKEDLIVQRQVLMLRQALRHFVVSAKQVEAILHELPGEPTADSCAKHRVEVLIAAFGRVIDLENCNWARWLGFKSYDTDGNGYVLWDEVAKMRAAGRTPYLELLDRLGYLNLYNPLRPDGEYALQLSVHEERKLAEMLVMLTEEPGENLLNETFNGLPFEVGQKWLREVPGVSLRCSSTRFD